ncbi:unnamed protein product, partial [marine sediment metagenome]
MSIADDLKKLERDIADFNRRLTNIRRTAGSFLGLIDTPASYAGQALKHFRVNAGENALEFIAAISTFLGLSDTPADYAGQTGKFCRVNVGEDGLEFAVGGGNGGGYGKEVTDENFDSLINGDIHGQGVYSGWGAWNTDVEDADCSAQIVANPANGKML